MSTLGIFKREPIIMSIKVFQTSSQLQRDAPTVQSAGHLIEELSGSPSMKLSDLLNGSQLAKMKRVSLTCPCHKICRDEADRLKSCKYT